MFLSGSILIALTLIGSINTAAVPNIRTFPERRTTQSCHATDHFFYVSYSILIGVPYGGKTDCDDTYNALESATHSISNWQCEENDGNIQLWFNVADYSDDEINAALESRYPSVAGGFNCPNN